MNKLNNTVTTHCLLLWQKKPSAMMQHPSRHRTPTLQVPNIPAFFLNVFLFLGKKFPMFLL